MSISGHFNKIMPEKRSAKKLFTPCMALGGLIEDLPQAVVKTAFGSFFPAFCCSDRFQSIHRRAKFFFRTKTEDHGTTGCAVTKGNTICRNALPASK